MLSARCEGSTGIQAAGGIQASPQKRQSIQTMVAGGLWVSWGVWDIPTGGGESLGLRARAAILLSTGHGCTWQEETGTEGHWSKANLGHKIP